MSEFFLKSDRRRRLLDVLRKHDPDRAEYFLSMCEREIVSWLKDWPADSWKPTETAAEALERVRVKAGELLQAIECLDAAVAWLLFPLQWRDEERASSPGEERQARQAIKTALTRIQREAETIECLPREIEKAHAPHDGPVTRRPDQDLSDRLARAYTDIFRDLPSTNMEAGVFAAFCEEIANDMPAGVTFVISRTILERSRQRCAYLLPDSPK